nr:hypothetical protein [Salmonid herpesvirus 1]
MESPHDIPSELAAEFCHFIYRKINTRSGPRDRQRLVFKCLMRTTAINESEFAKETLPAYSKLDSFLQYSGGKTTLLLWTNFRLLVLYHFVNFVTDNQHYSRYIHHKSGARVTCLAHLTRGNFQEIIPWHDLIPRSQGCTPGSNYTRLFQLSKGFRSLTPSGNVTALKIQMMLSAYTVEEPLMLIKTLVPDIAFLLREENRPALMPKKTVHLPQEDKERLCVLYHCLNADINWVRQTRGKLINQGLTLSGPVTAEHPADTRCKLCGRAFTMRSTARGGNRKNDEMVYDTDTHAFKSACCNAPVIRVPLYSGDTRLTVYTPTHQSYRLSRDGCRVEFSENCGGGE